MKIQCKKCYSYFEDNLEQCPYCGARIIKNTDKNMEMGEVNSEQPEILFCQYCGTKIESGAAFCVKCGKPVISQKNNSSKINYHGKTNFVMDLLRRFGSVNESIKKAGVISAIILAIFQIFGMKYTILYDGWSGKEKIFGGGAIKFVYSLLTGAGELGEFMDDSPKKFITIGWLCLIAFVIGYIALLVIYVMMFRMYKENYHIYTVISAIKSMSTCAIVIFGFVVVLGLYIGGKMNETELVTFNINILSWLGLIYAAALRIGTGMIISSQLESE